MMGLPLLLPSVRWFPVLALCLPLCLWGPALALAPAPPLPPAAPPLLPHTPFPLFWNAPTHKCKQSGVLLDLSAMQADTTPALRPNQFLTLFYKNRLGALPYTDPRSLQQHHGGFPQGGDLAAHLERARADVARHIPSLSSPGLAVVDWEEWVPVFDRNQEQKEVYRNLSRDHALRLNPSLPPDQLLAEAKAQFQKAAKSYMEQTLALGARERPLYKWGFYLFPDCYNYNVSEPGYTGCCSALTRQQNDELHWLWEASSALYPSAYLQSSLSGDPKAALFVRHQVQEALRVAALPKRPHATPVFVYLRPVFGDQNGVYLSEEDLVRSVGESAALGAAGAVMWGASADFNNKESCEALSSYLTTTLNPYIANVTGAVQLCSRMLCEDKGRCVRKDPDSDDYLHLSPASFRTETKDGRYQSVGMATAGELEAWAESFTCQCYAGQECHTQTTFHVPHTEMTFRV